MKKIAIKMLRSDILDRYMETGLAVVRHSLKKEKFNKLQNLPVNLFGSVMGIAGLALAWRQAAGVFGMNKFIGEWIGWIAVVVFVIISIFYLLKFFLFRQTVIREFTNPVVGNFFGTIAISVLLLSSVITPYAKFFGEITWIIGTVLTLLLAHIIINRLIKNKQDLLHATPAWLIPGVGTLDIAVTSGTIPFAWTAQINLLAFAIGSILALVFFTLIFSRLMHHDPMPERLTPSLIILVAPFEVGFLAYINITGEVDMFASVLFYFGLFLFTILFFKVFNRKVPFMINWWAVGFPIAALTNASIKYAMHFDSYSLKMIAALMLAILTLVILVLFIRTLSLLLQKKLLA